MQYNTCRKFFSKAVQRCKRKYWYTLQEELLSYAEVDQNRFWKSIGKIGINSNKNKSIPMEIVDGSGSVISNPDCVLNKWKDSFEDLYNDDQSLNFSNDYNAF